MVNYWKQLLIKNGSILIMYVHTYARNSFHIHCIYLYHCLWYMINNTALMVTLNFSFLRRICEWCADWINCRVSGHILWYLLLIKMEISLRLTSLYQATPKFSNKGDTGNFLRFPCNFHFIVTPEQLCTKFNEFCYLYCFKENKNGLKKTKMDSTITIVSYDEYLNTFDKFE